MTAMQRRVGVRSSHFTDDGFDMWYDYLKLGGLLERLRDRPDESHRDSEGPKKEQAAPWSHIQTSGQEEACKTFKWTSSASSSSFSDTSSNGTCSEYCRFCKQNGESASVYRSHKLKSNDGKVICPVLWKYTCSICKATGDKAHTRRYCPQVQAARMLPGSSF
ncbi:nanos homolog 1 [Centropristis striata]|uniref:nanos homolog 1 n=1 Tax=Centropristis striata TaxID=184440 RepID=UPI0027E09C31|nr:nanos homolog 1 [Centropristis striata]